MDISNLLKLRKLIPGAILVFYSAPGCMYFADIIDIENSTLLWVIKTFGTFLAFILGALFSGLGIREKFNKNDHKEITGNIVTRLRSIAKKHNRKNNLYDQRVTDSERSIMHIFYSIVDNDESLKEKSKIVKDNGLLWSSSIDIIILSTPFSVLYILSSFILFYKELNGFPLLLTGYLILFILYLFEFTIRPLVLNKHIKLSNDQIDYIEANLANLLSEKMKNAN